MCNKAAFALCLVLIFFFDSRSAHAAQTFYLPRQFSPAEMGTIGVALVNPIPAAALATFRWRTPQGETVATTQRAIPAKGQSSFLVNQLFPAARVVGWLSLDVDVDQVSAFWLAGDFVNSTDGAPLLNSRSATASPAFLFLTSRSEISFVNSGSAMVSGFLSLYNSNGFDLINVPFEVPALGVFQQSAASLFPAYSGDFDSNAYWIRVNPNSSTAQLAGTALTTTSRDNIVNNTVTLTSKEFLFPHIVEGQIGGAVYDTQLSLANLQSAPQDVTLTLRQSSGATLTVQRTLPGTGMLRTSMTSLFGVTPVDGWLLVTNSGGNSIAGLVTYTDLQSGGVAGVEMQAQPADTALLFGHIADLNPWWTGLALVNASGIASQVEVYAIDASGNLIGGPGQNSAASFTIAGQSKKTFLLSDVVPGTQNRTVDGGYVYVRSANGVGVYGAELLFLRSGRVYASVPAASLAGTTFSATATPSTNAIRVSVAPAALSIRTGETEQFIATVSGTPNGDVTWTVNDIPGGNSNVGTITPGGLYTAPEGLPDSNPVTIKASSTADVNRSGSSVVVVAPTTSASTARFLTITSGTPPAATVGVPYVFTFTAAGGRGPYTWAAMGATDDGLTLDRSTGILSGTPFFTGVLPLSVEVTDADGVRETIQYEMRFNGFGTGAAFITNYPVEGTETIGYFFKFTTSWTGLACAPAITLVSGDLPPGLILDGTNMTISGTPLNAGTYTFTLIATGGGINCSPPAPVRTNAQTFTLVVNKLSGQGVRGASNWVRASDFPVLAPSSGAWDDFGLRSSSVITVANDLYVYRMYYEGEDSQTHTRQVGLATSFDGIRWTKAAANPIVRTGPAGSKDAAHVQHPSVLFDGGTYRMWYSGIDDRDGCASILLATSQDGITWTKSSSNPVNLSNCDYIPGTVIKTAGTFMMWYSRKQGGIGVATSTDGIRWNDRGAVISNFTDIAVANPAVVLDASVYRMWFNMTSGANKAGIGFATSTDGITWTVALDAGNNPVTVFAAGADGKWDRPGVGQGSVMLDPFDSLFKMWYIGGPIDAPLSGPRALTYGSVGQARIPQ